VIFYARDGCESFYTAKTLNRHKQEDFAAMHTFVLAAALGLESDRVVVSRCRFCHACDALP